MSELPNGWAEICLADVCVPTEQVTPDSETPFTYIDIASVDRDSKKITSPQTLLGKDAPSRARKLVKTGDTLVSMTRPNLNAVALVGPEFDGQIASTGFDVLRSTGIDPRWVGYLVRTHQFVDEMSQLVQGALYPAVSSKNVRSFRAPLAPLPEQKRIADKLDATLARVDACCERLARVAPILKRFRQSVLAAATSGQLTADWREQQGYGHAVHDDKSQQGNAHGGSVGWADEGSPTSAAHGERGASQTQPNLRAGSQKLASSDFSALALLNDDAAVTFPIPDEWHWASLHGGILSASYGTSSKSSKEGTMPVLRMGNLQGGKLDWSDLVYSSDESDNSKYALKSGDILFNRTNSPELVGKTSLYRGERPAIYAGYLIRVQANPLYLLPDYLNICLNSPYGKEYCWAVKSDGVSQSNINAEKLKNLPVPYCSVNEQTEIVRRVETLFAFADRLEARLASATTAAERLTPSLLAKAFRGELVPQDPNDEPASELLKRLAAQREAMPKAKRGKKSATTA